jgi:hypothetical protein
MVEKRPAPAAGSSLIASSASSYIGRSAHVERIEEHAPSAAH